MKAEKILFDTVKAGLKLLYSLDSDSISFQKTRKEFEGDFTLVTFPFTKETKKSPEQIAKELGSFLLQHNSNVKAFNVVKGFLNISLNDAYWLNYFESIRSDKRIGFQKPDSTNKMIMVEFSSPNTNKPLHLGHVRNILLGYSVAQILSANGHTVIKTNLVNDRGIHICKSMLAWEKFGNGETPQSIGLKGDHLVGKYYVEFDKAYKKEIAHLVEQGMEKNVAEKEAPLMRECQQMLRLWEKGDLEVLKLWSTMNGWVYEGFDVTYKSLGVNFDKIYYESNTYLRGKEVVQQGLQSGLFYKKENGSIAIDLTADGLDEKIILRGDGTSVYITQDLGTAVERFLDYPKLSQIVYTVGNEQDYHFKALFKILEKLKYSWATECYHLSYGMVELPEGKMKSREGTVVDADDLIEVMFNTAKSTTEELGKVDDFSDEELNRLYKTVSMGALKYFILKVDPRKKMLFDPKESIDFNGHTGPFIQYTHARIKSVLRKSNELNSEFTRKEMDVLEREIVKCIYDFESVVEEAGNSYSPAVIANYAYELTKLYNRFYHDLSILKEEDNNKRGFRLALSTCCAQVLNNAMSLLGIEVPERM